MQSIDEWAGDGGDVNNVASEGDYRVSRPAADTLARLPYRLASPNARAVAETARRYTVPRPGRLAQLGEHQLDKLGVTGSSPVAPTREAPETAPFSIPPFCATGAETAAWKAAGKSLVV
jgi:hypothetical protein